jgi:hypothetical protein
VARNTCRSETTTHIWSNPRKDEKSKKEDEDDAGDVQEFADQRVIRIKSKKAKVDLQNIQRKDLFYHPEHGYLKVVQLKLQDEDDEESGVKAIKCCKLDAKGKKTEDEVELTKKDLK